MSSSTPTPVRPPGNAAAGVHRRDRADPAVADRSHCPWGPARAARGQRPPCGCWSTTSATTVGASKKFVVQAERDAPVAGFQVLDGQGRAVFEGKLGDGRRARPAGQGGQLEALAVPARRLHRVRHSRAATASGCWSRGQARARPGPSRSPSRRGCWPTRRCRTWCSTSSRSGHRASTTRPTGRCRSSATSGKRADLHGGWYDASGDVSKYLSHLSYANYMNPQQTPLRGLERCCRRPTCWTPVKTRPGPGRAPADAGRGAVRRATSWCACRTRPGSST